MVLKMRLASYDAAEITVMAFFCDELIKTLSINFHFSVLFTNWSEIFTYKDILTILKSVEQICGVSWSVIN